MKSCKIPARMTVFLGQNALTALRFSDSFARFCTSTETSRLPKVDAVRDDDQVATMGMGNAASCM